ncbi:MAG TPA: hypothetical protein VL947_00910 [Cytophagales bacterium]|nr:hypothetical protein [Cytophagales bacterium]
MNVPKMNTVKKIVVAALALSLFHVHAQTNTIKLKGTRLTYPIFNKWITEFNKVYPHIKVQLAHAEPADSIDLTIAAYKLGPEDLKDNKQSIVVNRYAQIIIANSNKADLHQLQQKGLTEKDIKGLYFQKTPSQASQAPQLVTLYRRETPACASVSFAKHYGGEFKDLRGIGVQGDDKDLLRAVKNDHKGLSYNNLGFIYDLKKRNIVDSIAVIPIDLNENGKIDASENIYGTLDQVITFIEKTQHPKIPVEEVNVIFDTNSKDPAVQQFLDWILTEGQKYNHEFGFINQEPQVLAQQKEWVSKNFKN